MPRAGGGTGAYSLPAIYLAIPGTTILATQHNTPLEDIANTFNQPYPIAYGGTFAGTAVGGSDNLSTSDTIASSATTDLGNVTGVNVTITGTTTITNLGTAQAGAKRWVTFSGALTLTYNATSLILPGAADILTTAGDVASFFSLGAGNWRCLSYVPSAPVPNTLNGQYKFPATQNPSSNANTLDDYEEGTWTPIDNSAQGLTFTNASGTYTKIGRIVHITATLTYPGGGSGAANSIGGLPFACLAGDGSRSGTLTYTNVSAVAYWVIAPNTTTGIFYNSGGAQLTNSDLNGALLYVSGSYPTS